MTSSSFKTALFVSSALVLAVLPACVSEPAPGGSNSQVSFERLQMVPVSINVSAVNAHITEGTIGGEFVADPVKVMQDYLQARFAPRGMQNSLEVTIEQAVVTKDEKQADSKVARYFNMGGHDVYNITLRVRFDYVETGGRLIYGKVFTARRIMNISQHASIAERERREVEGLENMLADLDVKIRQTVINEMQLGL